MFVGLVKDPGRDWRPPDDGPDPGPRRSWNVQWGLVLRVLAWVCAIAGMFALVPIADRVIGDFAGYVLILATVALGVWRIDRWCAGQYWRGLKDYQS
jgi:hypothetical protein